MLSAILSIFVVLASWGTAHLLTFPVEFLVQHIRLDAQLAFPASHPFAKLSNRNFLRGLIFAALLMTLDLSLAALSGAQPSQDVWKIYFQSLTHLPPTLLKSVVDNIMFFFSIFVIYQTAQFINLLFPRLVKLFNKWRNSRFTIIRIKGVELFTPDQITDGFINLLRHIQIGINLALIALGFTLGLSIFPSTQDLAYRLVETFFDSLKNIGLTLIGYLPNLLALLIIAFLTRYTQKFLSFLHNGIREKK